MITEERLNRMKNVLKERTEYCTVMLENLYDPHNISAILRTAEAFGVQNIHIVEKENQYKVSESVSIGADKWLDIHKYTSTKEAVQHLKNKGYKVFYADVDPRCPSLYELPLDQPFCIIMGKEKEGLSKEALEMADSGFTIPLYGFVESFNVSVACAVILSNLIPRLRQKNLSNYFLSSKIQEAILNKWLLANNFSNKVQKSLSKNEKKT